LFLFLHWFKFLRGGGNLGLDEVVLHETLKVEVSELVVLTNLQKLGELNVRDDLATIGLVLKRVAGDVRIDFLAHLSAGHLGANGLAEERCKLIADASGLNEAGRLTVAVSAALLGGRLLRGLHVAGIVLLDILQVALESRKKAGDLLDLGAKLSKLYGS